MGQDAGTGERIYGRLKTDLLTGIISHHARLDFAELSNLYGVSTTPVREAAMRLLGEGLIEIHPKGGARPARLSEYRLRALLDAHGKLLQVAWGTMVGPIETAAGWASAASDEARARLIFLAVARSTANPELIEILERLADRLAPFRVNDERSLGGVGQELDAIHAALSSPPSLRRLLRAYHRRRMAKIATLVWAATVTHE